MKFIFNVLLLAGVCLALPLSAQDKNKKTTTEKPGDVLNKAGNKLLEGLFKTPPAQDNKNNQQGDQQTTSPEGDVLSSIGGMLGGMGFNAKPAAQYEFDGSYTMSHTHTSKDGKVSKGRTEYLISYKNTAFGMHYTQLTASEDKKSKKAAESVDMLVMDLAQNAFFTFLTDDKKAKTYVGISFDPDKNKASAPEKNTAPKPKFTKTGRTKVIMSYTCDEYLSVDENGTRTSLWFSQKKVPGMSEFGEHMKKISEQNKQSSNSYLGNKEIEDLAKSGRAMLGSDVVTTDGDKTEMVTEDIKPNAPQQFDCSAYKSVMEQMKQK